jgi:predicted membrane protein
MTKEKLDSDRINYLIWRYVFLVIHPLGFQVQRLSLTAVTSQVSLGIRFVHAGFGVSGPW